MHLKIRHRTEYRYESPVRYSIQELRLTPPQLAGQQVDVLNVNSGKRFTTYAIEEPAGSKNIGVYGAAAHLVEVGDIVIIIAYAHMTAEEAQTYKPKVLILDDKNNVVENV